MLTDYTEIYHSEIFQKSQCIELENSLMDFFQRNLSLLGYSAIDRSKKIWRRNCKTVVICLVDDISTCSNNKSISSLFDSNTVVITDNRIYSPTNYRVLTLPKSFFGIYYYQPENTDFTPNKNINLSVNRLNPVRQLLLLELISHNPVDDIFKNLNIKFNCFMHNGDYSTGQLIANFKSVAAMNDLHNYQDHYNQLLSKIPIDTHGISIESAVLQAYINVVIETYHGTQVVSLSEKIFRSLVTPAPWTVYSGKHTVAFLKSLGLDVLDDLVDHAYSSKDYNSNTTYRLVEYISSSVHTAEQLKKMPIESLRARCQQAAAHNQACLAGMRQQWPVDFAQWWSDNIKYVS
jgi:hypothetical protein